MAFSRKDVLSEANVPQLGKPETSYPTPNKADRIVIERMPMPPSQYEPLPYHSPHPDYDTNGLFLCWQGKVKAENNQLVIVRVYANDEVSNEDWYNAAIKYSGDVRTFPVYVRSYIDLREDYDPAAQASNLQRVIRLRVLTEGTYTSRPTVTITPVGAGVAPTARAIMNPTQTKVIALELLTNGSGLTANPTVGFSGGGETVAATASATIQGTGVYLVKEETSKLDSEDAKMASMFIKVHRIYETLPGPKLVWDEYKDERGAVQRTTQSVLAVDTTGAGVSSEAAALTRLAGIVTKTWFEPRGDSAIVLTKIVETWTEVVINDKRLGATEWGGAILKHTETTDGPGVQMISGGYLIGEAKLVTKSPNEQTKVVEEFDPDSAIPNLELVGGGTGYPTAPGVVFTGGTGPGGAVANSVLGFGVNTVAVSAGGGNYTTPPSVKFRNAIGGGALAIANLSYGIVSVPVTGRGSGYGPGVPAVNVTGGAGSGATLQAVLGFGVYYATVTDPGGRAKGTLTVDSTLNVNNNDPVTIGGLVYTFKTTLTASVRDVKIGASNDASLLNLIRAINFTGTPGTDYVGSVAHPTVSAAAAVTAHAFTVTALSAGVGGNSIGTTETSSRLSWGATTLLGGFSYTEVPYAVITGGGGDGALGNIIMGSPVGSINITNHGTGYIAGNVPTISVLFGNGSGLAATAYLGFAIASITASVIGSGYIQATTTVTIAPPEAGGIQATANPIVTINGPVESVTIDSGGSGYTAATPVFTAGAGSGATGTATIGFEVASVTLLTAGTGYTSFPSATIGAGGGGGGTGAAIQFRMGLEAVTAVISGGTGYAVNDILDVVGGSNTTVAQLRVTTVSGTAVTGVSVETVGLYSSLTSNPHGVTGGTGGTTTETLTYSTPGDTNGMVYRIGTNFTGTGFTNPHVAGRMKFIKDSSAGADDGIAAICNRATSYITTDEPVGHWIGVDIGANRTITVSDYTLQNGAADGLNAPSNWRLEGSNNVAFPYDVGAYNAATWVTIDNVVNDTSIAQTVGSWGAFSPGDTNAYRFLRVVSTGFNRTGTLNYLQIGEIEFYGAFVRPVPASGAQFTLKWLVAQLTLTNAGTLYTSAPAIVFSGGGAGTQATASSTLASTGSVKSVTMTAGGSAYTGNFTVTFTGDGSGATGVGIVTSGAVTGYTITEPGMGYVDTPAVTIHSPGGVSAVGTAVKQTTGGGVWRITVTAGGVYELPFPTLNVSGGDGTGAAATTNLDFSQLFVARLHVTLSGHGYTSSPTVNFFYSDGTVPTDLAATTTLKTTGGEVVRINVIAPGAGWLAGDVLTVAIDPPPTTGDTATATAVLGSSGKVASVTVLRPGLFRTTPDVEFESVDGSGAVATATLFTTGSVVALNLTTLGDYITAPAVSFSGTHTTAATAIYHINDAEWPTLPGFDTDDVTGIVVDFFKKTVPTPTLYPGHGLTYRGPFIEAHPYDQWKTIQIVKAINLNSLPLPEAWYSTHPWTRPPKLLSIEVVWSGTVGKSADATKDTTNSKGGVSVSVHSGASGDVIIRREQGFHGKALCIVARDYYFGQVPASMWGAIQNELAASKIIGASGSIVVIETSSSTFRSLSDDLAAGTVINNEFLAASYAGGKIGDNFQKQVHAVDVSDHLVGNYQVISEGNYRFGQGSVDVTRRSQPVQALGVSGGGKSQLIASAGTLSEVHVRIPLSSPTPEYLFPGRTILVDAEPREWRFGVWVLERIYVIVPPYAYA